MAPEEGEYFPALQSWHPAPEEGENLPGGHNAHSVHAAVVLPAGPDPAGHVFFQPVRHHPCINHIRARKKEREGERERMEEHEKECVRMSE